MTNVRLAAARVLLAVEQGQTTLAAEVERGREGLDDARDRALLLDLASGTLRWRNEIDALVEAASRRTVGDIDPHALATIRLGAYQIRHLDRVPPHALVNESVESVKSLGAPRAAGFVNAVLRTLLRTGNAIALPARPAIDGSRDAQVAYLTVTLSHPGWLVERWIDRHGFDATEAWCRFNNQPPVVAVRARASDPGVAAALADALADAVPSPLVPGAFRLAPGALGRLSPEQRALLTVQDEGAQLIAYAVGARPGERVLDTCAAPGGKALVLAEAVGASGFVVASDYRHARVRLLARTLRAGVPLGGAPTAVVRLDASAPLPFVPVFDRVLVDAPCSGLGTLRRDPDLKWSRRPEDLPRLAARQAQLLRAAAEGVRPGGRLVYATCSSEPEENEHVVAAFLASDTRFTRGPLDVPGSLVDDAGAVHTWPHRDGLDAFFAAGLVRDPTA